MHGLIMSLRFDMVSEVGFEPMPPFGGSSPQGRLSDPNLGRPRQMFLCPEITMLKGLESSSPGLEEFQDRTQSSKTLSLDNLRTELYLTIQGPDLLSIEIAL